MKPKRISKRELDRKNPRAYGRVYVSDYRPIYSVREILRGRNKGKLEVHIMGNRVRKFKKLIVSKTAVHLDVPEVLDGLS